MNYKSVPILFFTYHLALISQVYSFDCPKLSLHDLKQLIINSNPERKDSWGRQINYTGWIVRGYKFDMDYSKDLEDIASSKDFSDNNKLNIEPKVVRSDRSDYIGPQLGQDGKPPPDYRHSCKYKVSVPKVVYEPIPEMQDIEIFTYTTRKYKPN